MKKKIIITGGSGFVGSYIATLLAQGGYEIVIIDRIPPREPFPFVAANIAEYIPQDKQLKNPYAVIHLAGKNVLGRFTHQHKKEIYDSRISGTQNLVQLFSHTEFKPEVLVAASAVGYFGDRTNELLDEASNPGSTFLATLVKDWEEEILQAKFASTRTVVFRQGHVFGAGGFLATLIPLYKKGLGGPLGSGHQWLPWIHIHDLAHLYAEALENKKIEGIYNVVARTQTRYQSFSKMLAYVLYKPHWLSIPRWLLTLKFGREFAREMTVSQRVVSHRLPQFDYQLQFNHLEGALRNVVSTY